ncbi:peptidase S8/S53 domain-containing protein [Biscogniauxia mediterranea]|nr:peptidase S8/S53 domain-containing protein [Biscogniauxia mediterranea]
MQLHTIVRALVFSATASALVSPRADLARSDPTINSSTPAEEVEEFVPGAYIVELDDNHGAEDFYKTLASEDGVEVDHRMDLSSTLFKGASFKVKGLGDNEQQLFLSKLRDKLLVKNAWPVRIVKLGMPQTATTGQVKTQVPPSTTTVLKRQLAGNDTFSPHTMTQVDKLRAKGVTGTGFRIAIVDSGIDWKHPALGGCFGPGCLVEAGYDFTGDHYLPPGIPSPDSDPYDNCVGHGTHVAGIIAAQLEGNEFGFTGVAPGVKLAAYRAWGCPATSTTEILIAAFNRAFEDGADIISCSDGAYSGWAEDAWGLVASRIVEAGVPVTISEGNDGGFGLFFPSTPATGHAVTGVGAISNTLFPVLTTPGSSFVGSDNTTRRDFGYLSGTPAFQDAVELPLWSAGNGTGDACSPLPDSTPDLSDKIVLLKVPERSQCFPIDQGANIVAKGGKYVMYYAQSNLTFEEQYLYVDGIAGVAIVPPYQGAQWLDLLHQGQPVTVAVPGSNFTEIRLEELENGISGGYMTDFSSWGPTWELKTSPLISAPGGNILSTFPVDLGAYRVMSGTSMSCPLVAGVYALLGEARGTSDPKVLANVLSATAKQLVWFDRETAHSDIIAPVPQQGAGIIQAYDAAYTNAILSVDSISFNDTDHFGGTQTFSINNIGAEDVTFDLGHLKAATMYAFASGTDVLRSSNFPNTIVEEWAELSFEPAQVIVPAADSANVTVTVTPPSGLNSTLLPVYSGYITLKGSSGESLSLPYQGVVGSMLSTPVLDPSLVAVVEYNTPVPANKSYTFPRPSDNGTVIQSIVPNILVRPILGTRVLRIDVVALDDNTLPTTDFFGVKAVGSLPGYPLPFASRSEVRTYFNGLLSDGTVVPEGSYKLAICALRIFGDVKKADDWDIIETVSFNIQYSS